MMNDLPVLSSENTDFPTTLSEHLRHLAEKFRRDREPDDYLAERSALVDDLAIATTQKKLRRQSTFPFALIAVGGYGRCELFPFSDIDVLLLVEKESNVPLAKEPLSVCLQILWDAGLNVAHSTRTIEDCCALHERNVELHVSLLDARFLCGDVSLFHSLEPRLAAFYVKSERTLSQHIAGLASKRHAKFNHTVYHLEPNIKEGPGGLRDLHLLHWLMKLSPQHEAIQESVRELERARYFLFQLRCFVHLESNRDNNLLTFELQDEGAHCLPAGPMLPEAWMRSYFRNARMIFATALRAIDLMKAQDPSLLGQLRNWRSRLSTPEFTVLHERILLRNPAETISSPDSLLRLFIFAARHGVRLSWDTQRFLRANASNINRVFAERTAHWGAWQELLSQPYSANALAEMQETGILAAAIPEWEYIDSLVVRDFYHRYTVDEHTLVAIAAIDELAASKDRIDSRFSDLLREDDNPALIRFALLLHDLGKGTSPGEHVPGSMQVAKAIASRLGCPDQEQDLVVFLIEHHLDLWGIMNSRDVEDPATARHLAATVGTQERLRKLALLTFADITAVNSTAMTPWRVEQLWRVYALGEEQLTRELVTDRIQGASDLLTGGEPSAELAKFLDGFPTRYLRTHSREMIEHHQTLSEQAARWGVAVEISQHSGMHMLTALAHDSPGLFASLCGTLASFGMNIVKAEAFSNSAGTALDEFSFTDPMGTLELNVEEIEQLRITVKRVVSGELNVRELLKRRPKPRPSAGARVSPTVHFNNEVSERATLIDFAGEDRPGLLYDLASVLRAAECNIELVMINTEAHRAIDVIYVTRQGRKLNQATEDQLGVRLLEAANGSQA